MSQITIQGQPDLFSIFNHFSTHYYLSEQYTNNLLFLFDQSQPPLNISLKRIPKS